MTIKPSWKRVVIKWINKRGEQQERVIPKRHGKRYNEHKRAKQLIRPNGVMLGKGRKI